MGTVTGPASSTDTAVARWNGTTGTVIQDSTVTIDGSGNVTGVASLAGNVTTTTQSQGDNSTNIATTAYVDTGLGGLSLDSLSDVITDYTAESMYLGSGSGVSASGGGNIGLGPNSMNALTTGGNNIAIGHSALLTCNTGSLNVAIGPNALDVGTSPGNNVAVGWRSLQNCNSTGNVGVGYNSGVSISSGQSNTAIGFGAGFNISTGNENVMVGAGSGSSTLRTGSGNILIGFGVDVPSNSTSNWLNIGDAITGDITTGPVLMDGFTATTQSPGDNSDQIATTAYVDAAITGGLPSLSDGDIWVGNSSNVATAVSMSGDVTIDDTGATSIKTSVALAGSPTTTTQSAGDNSTKIATTAYVDNAVSPGSGALVLLATATASSSATLDFTAAITSTYQEYIFELIDLIPATNATDLWIRVSLDGGSTWKSGSTDYTYSGIQNHGGTTGSDNSTSTSQFAIIPDTSHYSNAASQSVSGQIRIYNPANSASKKRIMATVSGLDASAGTVPCTWIGMGSYIGATTAVNGVRFLMSSGNIASGVIHMYGVKKS